MDAMINATWFQAKEYDDKVMGKGVIPAMQRFPEMQRFVTMQIIH